MEKEKTNLYKILGVLSIVAALFFAAKTVAEVKNWKYVGSVSEMATISFSGDGEVFAAPDIAMISVNIREEGKDAKTAQDKAVVKEKAVLEFLAKEGIEKKDIKTESYNSYPKYDYGSPCYGTYCPERAPKVIGYEVAENISVKVRDLEKAGTLVQGIGALGIMEISGPNFSIENEDELKAEARQMAIGEAKAKAARLADDLGVRLVRIVNFSEDGAYPRPMFGKAMMAYDTAQESAAAPAPELPQGENKIISNVTITYEIR